MAKNLEAAHGLINSFISDWEEYIEENLYGDNVAQYESDKDEVDTLKFIRDVIIEAKKIEESKHGDRLDKLLDHLYQDEGGYSMHALANIGVCLNVMEEHLGYIGEWDAMGRCNKLQHKIFG